MASRRAAVRLSKVLVPSARPANPACIRVAAQSVARQYHSRTQRQLIELVRQQLPPVLRRASFGPASARPYSTESEAKSSKIWDFEAVCTFNVARSFKTTLGNPAANAPLRDSKMPSSKSLPPIRTTP